MKKLNMDHIDAAIIMKKLTDMEDHMYINLYQIESDIDFIKVALSKPSLWKRITNYFKI